MLANLAVDQKIRLSYNKIYSKQQEPDMRLDPWITFNLPSDVRQLVEAFGSPETEVSFLKDIPIGALDQVRPALRVIERLSGKKTRVIYRGHRRDLGRSWCLRQDARRFAVYFR